MTPHPLIPYVPYVVHPRATLFLCPHVPNPVPHSSASPCLVSPVPNILSPGFCVPLSLCPMSLVPYPSAIVSLCSYAPGLHPSSPSPAPCPLSPISPTPSPCPPVSPTSCLQLVQPLLPEAAEGRDASAGSHQDTGDFRRGWQPERWGPASTGHRVTRNPGAGGFRRRVGWDSLGSLLPSDEGRHHVPGLQPRQPGGADAVVQGTLPICRDTRAGGLRCVAPSAPSSTPSSSPPAGAEDTLPPSRRMGDLGDLGDPGQYMGDVGVAGDREGACPWEIQQQHPSTVSWY